MRWRRSRGTAKPMSTQDDLGPLRFAERLLALIDATRYTATYKLAALLALIDVVIEQTDAPHGAPQVVSARDVGERVLELYWPQTLPFLAPGAASAVLRQSATNDIPAKLARFRERHGLDASATTQDAARRHPAQWDELQRDVVATVIRMPLAKLQRFGEGRATVEDRFVYDFAWPDEVAASRIEADGFDDRLHLAAGVGDHLVRLAPLLRPLLESKWAELVARRNQDVLDTHHLHEFLFGAQRVSLERVRAPLLDAQDGRCFYCAGVIRSHAAVDHFVPWSRHPDNLLDNLVVAHGSCNGAKSSSLAAVEHLGRWVERFHSSGPARQAVDAVATATGWPRRADRTLSAARGVYLWLPEGTRLWRLGREYEPFAPEQARRLLTATG